MDKQARDFKGIWIPKEVWLDERLNALEKIILVEIDSLDGEESGCYASNAYLSEFCQCSETKVSTAINKLKGLGYIFEVAFDGRERILKTCLSKNESLPLKNCKQNNIKNNKKEKYKKESAASIPNDTFSTADLDYWFDNTYLLYPRKVNKVKSKEAYEHKIRGLTRDEAKDKANAIFLAVKKQVALWNKENDYEGRKLEHIPYFSSWLNANVEDSPHFKRRK